MSLLDYLYLEAQSLRCSYRFCHEDKDCTSRAFDVNENIVLEIDLPRSLGASGVYLEVFRAYENDCFCEFFGQLISQTDLYDSFSFGFKLETGLYFVCPYAKIYGRKVYGRKSGGVFIFDGEGEKLQLTVSDFLYKEPTRIYGGIIYHIFVDRFKRQGNVKVNDYNILVSGEWDAIPEFPEYPGGHLKNNTLYGGTLYGIIEKLDYIASLGCNCIYLSPIFESVSNHKYDTADYMSVDSCFGGDEALKLLIDAAKSKGILIILDGVFNHTGSDSKYFNRFNRYNTLGAYQSKDSEYFEWYDFKEYPYKYTCWWDIEILPRINPDKLGCREYFVGKDGVIDKYRKMGIYGFRLDVADELSDDFISKIKERLDKTNTDDDESILYGEVWEDASNKIAYDTLKQYYLGSELDGVMNYPLRTGLIDYVLKKDTGALNFYFEEVQENTPNRILHSQMNLLGTHDTERIITILGGIPSQGYSNKELSKLRMSPSQKMKASNRLKSLYTVIATLPGVPTMFYGDEVGLEGYHDPFNRMPYPWGKEDELLLSHYRKIGAIRKNNDIYKKGSFKLLYLDSDLLVFGRFDSDYAFLTLYNNSETHFNIKFSNEFTSLFSNITGNELMLYSGSAEIIKTKRSGSISLL